LRGAGCNNNILLADARILTYELDGASLLPKYARRHYTVSGATAKGAFHPKILLQLGRRSGRLVIGSANMTASGLAGNLELAGVATCTADAMVIAWKAAPEAARAVTAAMPLLSRAKQILIMIVAENEGLSDEEGAPPGERSSLARAQRVDRPTAVRRARRRRNTARCRQRARRVGGHGRIWP
jgi:hypothetical protein